MDIRAITEPLSVCKVADATGIDLTADWTFVGKTDEELSLVCPTSKVPANTTEREDGWRAFRIEGTLDFSLVGILSRISGLLAEAQIGIFAVSTYNTDYVLTREKDFGHALQVLREAGYNLV